MEPRESNGGNRMLERVAALLDVVEAAPSSASELARRTGLSVSTAHRLALAMVEHDLLRRTDSGDFELGSRFRRTALEKAAISTVRELRDRTGESVQLWVRRGDDRVCVLSMDSPHELRVALPVGSRLALPDGSAGRVLAGGKTLQRELSGTGWLESVGRRTEGLGSVSAPVYEDDTVIAALCLALPLSRVHLSPGRDYGDEVVAASRQIGVDLAHLMI